MRTVAITGAGSGLGKCLKGQLLSDGWKVLAYDKADFDLATPEGAVDLGNDITGKLGGENLQCLINCAGINFIDWHEEIPLEKWDELMNVNARAMWQLTKQLIKNKSLGGVEGSINPVGTIVNIVSNASHMPMTNSAAYNASKGAAAILTRQMARELRKTHSLTVFGVSPNKMHSTEMSDYIEGRVCDLRGWTPQEAKKYQSASLPAMKETDPAACAEFIGFLLSTQHRHEYLNGCIMEYGI